MILRLVLAVTVALAVLSGWLWLQNGWKAAEIDALSAENASLSRSVAALESARTQAKEAAQVARAEAERLRAVQIEYDALRDTLINGGDDEALPEWFSLWLHDLLGRMP